MTPHQTRPHFTERLDEVEQRLSELATLELSGLTAVDDHTGERWDVGQAWAHMAEFPPYWIAEIERVVARFRGEPVPFGRVRSDPQRVAAIEDRRHEDIAALLGRVREGIARSRTLIRRLDPAAWRMRGVHETLGVMTLERIVDTFVVGHLEEHADQLDGLGL